MRRPPHLFGPDRKGQVQLAVAAAVAAVAMIALGLTLVYRTTVSQELREHTAAICRSVEALKSDLRATLQASRDRLAARTDLDPAQKAAALTNLDVEIRRYAPDHCPTH